ncbi:hypothetical protein Tco_0984713 [Tanacetum coccineum]
MISEDFLNKYPQAHAIFMPYLIFNHIPALLIIPKGKRSKKRSFKFANYITDKKEFCKIVEDKWKFDVGGVHMYNLVKKLKSLKHPLNNLNWSNGNLVEKVKILKDDLKKIQTEIDVDPYDKILRDKDRVLLEEYLEAIKDEEKLLYQKCKIKWLSYGDKNNSYFHKMLKGRSLNAPVSSIDTCEDLFATKLSPYEASQMVKPVTNNEIKKAMFSITNNKAPSFDGFDGFSAKFFKAAWHIVGFDVCSVVKEFFFSRKLLGELNATIISPIPKITTSMMGWGPKRAAFKIDIQKAYDTVSWDFMEQLQKHFGFLEKMRNWIMSTIFFGSIKEDDQQKLLSILPFIKGNLPVRYLGVPLISKRLGIKDCLSLIEKSYWCCVFLLLKTVINDINRIMKNFLWNQSDDSKGKAKVAWKAVCKPKNQGGLGLKDLTIWNNTLLVKHLWNIANKKDTLWVKWVSTVKLKGVSIWVVQKEECDSWGWKNLLAIRDLIISHVLYKIGNCKDTFMWYDNCSGLGPLIYNISHRILYNARLQKGSNVADMIEDGTLKNGSLWVNSVERNFRLFRDQKRDWKSLLNIVCDTIRARLMGLTVKNSTKVNKAVAVWDVKMNFKA